MNSTQPQAKPKAQQPQTTLTEVALPLFQYDATNHLFEPVDESFYTNDQTVAEQYRAPHSRRKPHKSAPKALAVPSDLAGELYVAADEIVAFLDYANRGRAPRAKKALEVDTRRVEQMVLNLGTVQEDGLGRLERTVAELVRIQTETLASLTATNQELHTRLATVESELTILKKSQAAADSSGTHACVLTRQFLLGHYEFTKEPSLLHSAEIYAAYLKWALAQGVEPVNCTWFGRQLRAVFPGVQRVQRRTKDGRPRLIRHLRAITSSEVNP